MSFNEMICSWVQEQAVLRQQLEMLESGQLKTGNTKIDETTAETKKEVKRKLAELDELLRENACRTA